MGQSPEARRFPRRQFLGLLAGGTAIGGLGLKHGDRVVKGIQAGFEYGPDLAMHIKNDPQGTGAFILDHPWPILSQVIKHRWESGVLDGNWGVGDVLELLGQANEGYKKSPFFQTRLKYSPNTDSNIIIAFGDSNMVGANGKDRSRSPVKLFAEAASKKPESGKWIDINLAQSGNTTQDVISNQLLSPEAAKAFAQSGRCIVWINAGGNDLSDLIRNSDEVDEIKQLQRDLYDRPDLLFKYAERMMDNLRAFPEHFARLLDVLFDQYSLQIDQLVVTAVPDFSKAPSITSQMIGNETYNLPLENEETRHLAHNASAKMNTGMFEVVGRFYEEKGRKAGINIVGIDTSDGSMSKFDNDQHLSADGIQAVANNLEGRMELII